ncbi:heterogeneous nuclear ribonucleoprotein HRP1 [Pisolithus thermaeus]|nr:heterogeneous nuclear ribonucleoprotein HRP1 [Pisolithus thermaeus]
MSELDADLYGDLYGNDEPDFTAAELNEAKADIQKASETSTETLASTAAPQVEAKQESLPGTISASRPKSEPTTQLTYQPIPTHSSPTSYSSTPQQIPTYQQPQPSDSLKSDRPHIPERSIRPSEMKDEGKMFIGGLNWDTTDESLRNYFSQFGKVDACTIMRDAAGRSRCFAFLTFEDPASVNAVMVREHFLDGKIIDPKRAIPRQEHQRATKLFIGGLPGSVTSESMRDFFSQFGKVIDSTVMLDRETGRSKGFGFVSFEDTDVTPFLGFGKLEIDGKLVRQDQVLFRFLTDLWVSQIDVKLAQPRYQRDNFNEDTRGGSFNAQSGGSFGASASTGGATNVAASMGTGMTAPSAGNTPFDPQALAALYTRMFQLAGGASMMGGMSMNPMMGGMGGGGFGGGFGGAMGGMGRGMGSMGMSGGMGSNMGGGMGGGGTGMGGGGGVSGGGMGRGSQGATQGGPPTGGPGGPGVGPQRAAQRGQHSYHPYARG